MSDLFGSRDTTREAFAQGLINDGKTWMEMIRHRNLSAHTYKPTLEARLQAQETLP